MPPPVIPRVTAEARGKLRQVKQRLVADYARMETLFPRLRVMAEEFVGRGSVKGRQRAFTKLDRLISPYARLCDLQLEQPAPMALWAALRPRDAVLLNSDDPGQQQDCIAINYLLVGAVNGPRWAGWADGLWTLEVSDHALYQLIARAPGVAIVGTLFSAHAAALLLPLSHFAREPGIETVMLRAPPGISSARCWPGTIRHSTVQPCTCAKTWLHADQLRDDQQSLPDGAPGDRLGESYLRPAPLRQLKQHGRSVRAWAPNWAPPLGMPAGTRQ